MTEDIKFEDLPIEVQQSAIEGKEKYLIEQVEREKQQQIQKEEDLKKQDEEKQAKELQNCQEKSALVSGVLKVGLGVLSGGATLLIANTVENSIKLARGKDFCGVEIDKSDIIVDLAVGAVTSQANIALESKGFIGSIASLGVSDTSDRVSSHIKEHLNDKPTEEKEPTVQPFSAQSAISKLLAKRESEKPAVSSEKSLGM